MTVPASCDHEVVVYNPEHDNFYCKACRFGMGQVFYQRYKPLISRGNSYCPWCGYAGTCRPICSATRFDDDFHPTPETTSMSKLIEALTIFLKYGDPVRPTHCEHDEMFVMINPKLVSAEDTEKLAELGFSPQDESFHSFRYGSA